MKLDLTVKLTADEILASRIRTMDVADRYTAQVIERAQTLFQQGGWKAVIRDNDNPNRV